VKKRQTVVGKSGPDAAGLDHGYVRLVAGAAVVPGLDEQGRDCQVELLRPQWV
jgi:inactivated superfamily I helicase